MSSFSISKSLLHLLLRSLSDVTQLGSSLHGISLHDNPWNCDCQLRHLRDWLVQKNIPRLYEPTCHTPHRLTGFKITTVSVTEFACLPVVSPTSMFITVREGKNVSLVCRIKSDPVADIRWSYNGLLIDSVHPRMRQVQQFEGSLGTRSELLITNTSMAENGSFLCSAENKAGKSMANYSVQVEPYRGDTLVMEMKMEHFIAVSVCVIIILILLMVIVTILLVKIARKHIDSGDKDSKASVTSAYKASSMPRSIQMGTGHVVKRAAPDLLSGVSQSQSSSDGSMVSMETVLTPANSDLSDMRDIIKDLGDHTQPLIGQNPPTNQNVVQPSWSVDNPYLHTSGPPYLVYRQRLAVRPDEQYPILNYQYQYSHQSPSPGVPYYTLQSNSSYSVPHMIAGDANPNTSPNKQSQSLTINTSVESKPIKSQNEEHQVNKNVISDSDTVTEMLNKLQGKVNKDEEDSEDISEELENAFPSLNLSTQCWDPSEGTRI